MSKFLSHIIPPQDNNKLVSSTKEWKTLAKHVEYMDQTHLRDLLKDEERCEKMFAVHDGVYLDYSRQRITLETMDMLLDLAEKQNLKERINAMVEGEKINWTENRAVLHTALRVERPSEDDEKLVVDGENVVEEVWEVLDQIKYFTDAVRSGEIRGFTGKRLRNIISVGIGGSYLGPEFLHECLKTEPEGITKSLGYTLRFLSNVDPVDVERACADLDPEETLVVIVSKTFTTAETMLNARTTRQWLWDFMGDDKDVVRKHMVAVSSISSIEKVEAFGIDTESYFFRFWDWVGGRYSVCSAVGGIPISLLYGFDLFEKFLQVCCLFLFTSKHQFTYLAFSNVFPTLGFSLQGAHSIDDHFINAPLKNNIPVIMGLLGVWNMSFLGFNSRATMPYAEALLKLPAHIQQLDMESNGKKATKFGIPVDYPVGEVDFGEPGTNGQHSFFQLLHMGQTVPCEFIGFLQSQHDICIDGETVSSHDELMANFFAQPDALANGKTAEEVRAEGVEEDLILHRTFEGNRPSLSILAPKLTAYSCGQLLALYEHRTAVQGFIWDINSFDQWGVELGKKLASDVKDHLLEYRKTGDKIEADNPATSRLLNYYVENSNQAPCEHLWDSNPLTSVTRKTHRDREFFPPVGHDLKGADGKLT
jgi:glucose-6-phosphate isomerase